MTKKKAIVEPATWTETLTFSVDGMPQTKGSWVPKFRRGRTVMVPDNDAEPAWAAQVAWAARNKLRDTMRADDRLYDVSLHFTLAPPVGRKNRRDIDKLARSVLDALTGIVWLDDERVKLLEVAVYTVGDAGAKKTTGLIAAINPMKPTDWGRLTSL